MRYSPESLINKNWLGAPHNSGLVGIIAHYYNQQMLKDMISDAQEKDRIDVLIPLLAKVTSIMTSGQRQYNFLDTLDKACIGNTESGIREDVFNQLFRLNDQCISFSIIANTVGKIIGSSFSPKVHNERIDSVINKQIEKMKAFLFSSSNQLTNANKFFQTFREARLKNNEITRIFSKIAIFTDTSIHQIYKNAKFLDNSDSKILYFLTARCESLVPLKRVWDLKPNINIKTKIDFLCKCLATLSDEAEKSNFIAKIGNELKMWPYIINKIMRRPNFVL